jgi:hypothetical protein
VAWKLVFVPGKPCSITIVGNGPSPVAGSVTSTSIGTPSKLGTRCWSFFVAQRRTPFCGWHECPKGFGGAAAAAAGRASRAHATSTGTTRLTPLKVVDSSVPDRD